MSLLGYDRELIVLVFLDDIRNPWDVTWINYATKYDKICVVRNDEGFIKEMKQLLTSRNASAEFSFDHDIDSYDSTGTEVTGYDLLKRFIDYCLDNQYKIPVCYFHTQNPVGKINM